MPVLRITSILTHLNSSPFKNVSFLKEIKIVMFINMTTGQRKEDKHSDNKKVVNIRYFSNNSKAMKPDGY